MSCDDKAKKTAECLGKATHIARSSGDCADHCRLENCDAVLLAGGQQCTKGHHQEDKQMPARVGTKAPLRPGSLPLEIREVSPGPGFTRLGGTHADGRAEGKHTGGAWLSPDGSEVWKPLDGRPHPRADHHLPTEEACLLARMAGDTGFPKNWRVAEAGEVFRGGRLYKRRWLVRAAAYPFPAPDFPLLWDREGRKRVVLVIEQAVRLLNLRGWGLGDDLTVAIDPDSCEPFILDLSAVHKTGPQIFAQGGIDEKRFCAWAELAGFADLVALREQARDLLRDRPGDPNWPRTAEGRLDSRYMHIYASRYRPMADTWAQIPEAYYFNSDWPRVHTWVVVPEPLNAETVGEYQLEWAWGPIAQEGSSRESNDD